MPERHLRIYKKSDELDFNRRLRENIKSGIFLSLLSEKEQEMLYPLVVLAEDIDSLPAVRRLKEVYQLGRKINPDVGVDQRGNGNDPAHTRFDHSKMLYELAMVAGIKLSLNEKEIKQLMLAGAFHDLGHPAFSHSGDEALQHLGCDNHEVMTAAIVANNRDIGLVLKEHSITADDVIEIMKERGALGSLQSAFDTLSYLIVDSEEIKKPLYDDFGRRILETLVGVDQMTNQLIVSDEVPWQELINYRAKMMRDLYIHPENRAVDSALRNILAIAIERQIITINDVRDGVDQKVAEKIHDAVFAVQSKHDMSDMKDLFEVAMGHMDVRLWKTKMCNSRAEAEAVVKQKRGRSPFIVEPYDFTKKTLTLSVMNQDGNHTIQIRANNVVLRDADKTYTVYYKKNIRNSN